MVENAVRGRFETDDAGASRPIEDRFSRAFDRVIELHLRVHARIARHVLAVEAVALVLRDE